MTGMLRVLLFALAVLSGTARADDVAAWLDQLESESALRRYEAARSLRSAKATKAVAPLVQRLDDPVGFVRLAVARALVDLKPDRKHSDALIQRLAHRDPQTAQLIGEILAGMGADVVEPIAKQLRSKQPRARRAAAYALQLMGRHAVAAVPALLDAILDSDPATKRAASHALRRIGPWSLEYLPELTDAAQFGEIPRRLTALRLLEMLGPAAAECVAALTSMLNDAETPAPLKSAVSAALQSIDVALPANVDPALADPKLAQKQAPATFRVKLETTKGDIIVAIERAAAPHGADRFFNLVSVGYFDDTAFFRVMTGFVAQFGMHGNTKINGIWREANIPDDKRVLSNVRGTLVFAQTGEPESRATQLFFNLKSNPDLDKQGFAPLGKIVSGIKVLDALFDGYGEGYPRGEGPSQRSIISMGNDYLRRNFPKLDYVRRARIVTPPKKSEKK